MTYKVGIIVASDKGASRERADLSGPMVEKIINKFSSFQVERYSILPDEQDILSAEMIHMIDEEHIDLILTSGGTGFSKRDVTPEATLSVIERRTYGITDAMRHLSLKITPRGMLSRAEAGIRGDSLIINLPGSPKAIEETLEYIMSSVKHGLDILQGHDSDCARTDDTASQGRKSK